MGVLCHDMGIKSCNTEVCVFAESRGAQKERSFRPSSLNIHNDGLKVSASDRAAITQHTERIKRDCVERQCNMCH